MLINFCYNVAIFKKMIDNGADILNIQDGIKEVKKELTSDEQMLAQAFKLEKFYKKHKLKLFSVVALGVLFFGGKAVMGMIEEHRLDVANQAYLSLAQNPNNQEALSTLKEKNPALFELFSYQQAIEHNDTKVLSQLSQSSNPLVADISGYHLAVIKGEEADSTLYNEMALVYDANLQIRQGKMIDAADTLAQIAEESPVYQIAQIIKHYTIKGH